MVPRVLPALPAGRLVSLVRVSQRLDSKNKMSASGQMRGRLKAFSSICGVRLSKGSTDGPSPQWDVLLCALCPSTHLTGQVCAEALARRGLGLGYCGFAWSEDMGRRSHDVLKFLIEHS